MKTPTEQPEFDLDDFVADMLDYVSCHGWQTFLMWMRNERRYAEADVSSAFDALYRRTGRNGASRT